MKPPKAQGSGPNAQAKGLANALKKRRAFLAGERPVPSGSTEGASGRPSSGSRQSLR
jgi:hypothetical protein